MRNTYDVIDNIFKNNKLQQFMMSFIPVTSSLWPHPFITCTTELRLSVKNISVGFGFKNWLVSACKYSFYYVSDFSHISFLNANCHLFLYICMLSWSVRILSEAYIHIYPGAEYITLHFIDIKQSVVFIIQYSWVVTTGPHSESRKDCKIA